MVVSRKAGVFFAIIIFISLAILMGLYIYKVSNLESFESSSTESPEGNFIQQKVKSLNNQEWAISPAFDALTFTDASFVLKDVQRERLILGERSGKVYAITPSETGWQKAQILDISGRVAPIFDGGLLNMVIDADFAPRPAVFALYTYQPPNASLPKGFQGAGAPGNFFGAYLRLSRFFFDARGQLDPRSEAVMIQKRVYNGGHRGGGLVFGNDGFLYVGLGDQFRYQTAQEIDENLEGGILRVDVREIGGEVSHPPLRLLGNNNVGFSDEFSGRHYFIPNDNPWLNLSGGVFEEYYAQGFRNPYRMALDQQHDQIWIVDVGEDKYEEVNILRKGGNFGWPYFEGHASFRLPKKGLSALQQRLVGPDLVLPHPESNALIGGMFYQDSLYPELKGTYFCGDYLSGKIWSIIKNKDGRKDTAVLLSTFSKGGLVSFGEGLNGEIYLLKGDVNFGVESPLFELKSSRPTPSSRLADRSPALPQPRAATVVATANHENPSTHDPGDLLSPQGILVDPIDPQHKKGFGHPQYLIDRSGFEGNPFSPVTRPKDNFKSSIWYTSTRDGKGNSLLPIRIFLDLGEIKDLAGIQFWLQGEYPTIGAPTEVSISYLSPEVNVPYFGLASLYKKDWISYDGPLTLPEGLSPSLPLEIEARYISVTVYRVSGNKAQVGFNELAFKTHSWIEQ